MSQPLIAHNIQTRPLIRLEQAVQSGLFRFMCLPLEQGRKCLNDYTIDLLTKANFRFVGDAVRVRRSDFRRAETTFDAGEDLARNLPEWFWDAMGFPMPPTLLENGKLPQLFFEEEVVELLDAVKSGQFTVEEVEMSAEQLLIS